MSQHSFDKQIREKVDGHEAPVPADAWANIEQQQKKRRYFIYWWLTGILLVAGVGLFGIYHVKKKDGISNTKIAAVENNKSKDFVPPTKTVSPGDNKINTTDTNTINNSPTISNDINNINDHNTTAPTVNSQNNIASKSNNIKPVTNPGNTTQAGSSNSFNVGDKNQPVVKIVSKNKKTSNSSKNKKDNIITDPSTSLTKHSRTARSNRGKQLIRIQSPATDENSTPAEENLATPNVINQQLVTNAVTSIATTSIGSNDIHFKDSSLVKNITLPVQDENPLKNNIPKKSAERKRRMPRFIVDVSVTPFAPLLHRDHLQSISRTTITPLNKATFTATDIRVSAEPSFSYTIALRKKIAGKTYLGAGVQYSLIKENIHLAGKETNIRSSVVKRLTSSGGTPVLVDDTLSVTTSGRRAINATNSYRFISIPLSVYFQLANKKAWSFYFSGGLYLNISSQYRNSIAGKLEPKYTSGGSPGNSNNKFTTDIYAGIRIARSISKKGSVYFEPSLQYNLMKYNMQNMINTGNLHRTGIAVGISWQLK